MVTPVARALGAASRRLAWVELFACKVLIVLFSALLVVNVSLRYGLNSPLYFAEELAVYILIWMAFLAISVSLHENTQIRLTLLTDVLPARPRQGVLVLMDVLVAAMLAVILWHAVGWIRSPSVEFELAITLGTGKAPFFAIIPLFCATALFHSVARLAAVAASGPAGAGGEAE
ncbi:TRAP transporter small permease [Novispirillum sp. DQ9]|uniref:TRAP transporter small permease n=1 Tax=Novispirillum sp. DQ9 TaxID=3398612 RepID=UPI003C79C81B